MNDELENKELEKQQKALLEAERAICRKYRHVFTTEEGEDVFADLLDRCGLFSVITGLAPNEDKDFHDGRRSIALEILTAMGITDIANIANRLLEVQPSENAEPEQEIAINQEEVNE